GDAGPAHRTGRHRQDHHGRAPGYPARPGPVAGRHRSAARRRQDARSSRPGRRLRDGAARPAAGPRGTARPERPAAQARPVTGPAPGVQRTGALAYDGTVDEIVAHLHGKQAAHPGLPGITDTLALAMIQGVMDSPYRVGEGTRPATSAWRCQRIRVILDAVQK